MGTPAHDRLARRLPLLKRDRTAITSRTPWRHWSDDRTALVASGALTLEGGEEGTLTEYRTLSKGGDVMTVQVTVTRADSKTATAQRAYRRQ